MDILSSFPAAIGTSILPIAAQAQEPGQVLTGESSGWLRLLYALSTLLIFAIALFIWFLRYKSKKAAQDEEREQPDRRRR